MLPLEGAQPPLSEPPPVAAWGEPGRIDWRYWLARREVIVLFILVAGSLIFNFTHNSYLTGDNIVSILSNMSVVAIISIAMTMVIVTGGIDVSV